MTNEEKNYLKIAIQNHLKNNFDLAFLSYSELIKHFPENHDAHNLLGTLLIQNGLHEQGEAHIKISNKIKKGIGEKHESNTLFDDPSKGKINQEIKSVRVSNVPPKRDFESVDAWRHLRMLDFVDCLVDTNDHWLTIGDAYGHDAQILKHKGVKNIVASNLETQNLAKAKEAGFVDKYLTINAESIDLQANSFDYVLCKESLHHMPRPYLALYEMLRVCRKGVFFVDPQDSYIDWPAKKSNFYREIVSDEIVGEKISFRKFDNDEELYRASIDWWEEEAFNYVYTFSKREIRKIAFGMGLPFYGFKCINDWYEPGIGGEPVIENGPGYRKTKEQIDLHDQLCSITGKPSVYIACMLFKRTPNSETRNRLVQLNYSTTFTPTRFLPIEWPSL